MVLKRKWIGFGAFLATDTIKPADWTWENLFYSSLTFARIKDGISTKIPCHFFNFLSKVIFQINGFAGFVGRCKYVDLWFII